MKQSLLDKMQKLSKKGYLFTRVQTEYLCQQLLPEEIDAKLDQLGDTPAYKAAGKLSSSSKTLLVVQRPTGQVAGVIAVSGSQGQEMLGKLLEEELQR